MKNAPTSGCEQGVLLYDDYRNWKLASRVKPLVALRKVAPTYAAPQKSLDFQRVIPDIAPVTGRPHRALGLIAGTFFEPPFPPMCVEDGNSRSRAPFDMGGAGLPVLRITSD